MSSQESNPKYCCGPNECCRERSDHKEDSDGTISEFTCCECRSDDDLCKHFPNLCYACASENGVPGVFFGQCFRCVMSGDIECSWNSDGFGETWMHGRKVYVLGKKDGYSKARKPTFKVEMIGKGKRRHVDPDGDISILKINPKPFWQVDPRLNS